MDAWGFTKEDLERVGADVGVRVQAGPTQHGRGGVPRVSFTLKLADERYRRRGFTGRRIAAVCWHGHRDFMRACFALNPDGRIKSAMADYAGADEFERLFEGTGARNIGSMVQPMLYREACDCDLANVPELLAALTS
jgi:hypothetical protein